MKNTTTKTFLTLVAACPIWFGSPASAAVSLVSSATYAGNSRDDYTATPNGPNVDITIANADLSSFNVSTGEKLVLSFANKQFNATSGAPVVGVSYGGVAMNEAIQRVGNRTREAVFYLDSPPAGNGDLVISLQASGYIGGTAVNGDPNNSLSFALYSLEETTEGMWMASGFADTATAQNHPFDTAGPTVAVSAPYTQSGFVVNTWARNNQNTVLSAASISDGWVNAATGSESAGGGALRYVHAYFIADSTGNYSSSYSSANGANLIAVSFVSVPEPSSALLFGLGALGFAVRRRRR